MTSRLLSTLLLSIPCALGVAAEPVILGAYVEARTCDVWTGPCFANGEMNLRGDNAVLAWSVSKGSWDGVELKNLVIVAVLDAEGTLTTDTEGKTRTVLYLDDRATEEQGKALISMAAALAPRYLKNVIKIEKQTINFRSSDEAVELAVGEKGEVKIKTSPLSSHCDSICGNESSFYPALSKLTHIHCAKTVDNYYSGKALGMQWSDPNRRSAMIGAFSL